MPEVTATSLGRTGWDDALAPLPRAHFLQSAFWGDFKSHYGWEVERLRFEANGRALGYACLLTRPAARGLVRVGYVGRGPTTLDGSARSLAACLPALEALARQRRCLSLKIEPELWDGDAAAASTSLRDSGWRPAAPVQFRNTVTLSLRCGEAELQAAMKPKTRYNIRLAERRGVVVDVAMTSDLGELYDLYRRTAIRDGFIVRPRAYYEALWSGLIDARMATVLLARHDGALLAGLVAVAYGGTAWYLHGASGEGDRNLMPTYLLQWRAIEWARARGCHTYDMWGAPETADESDPMHGVLRFKLGFGGELREGAGAWDFAPNATLYTAYTRILTRLLGLTRARRRRTQLRE